MISDRPTWFQKVSSSSGRQAVPAL